jgi:hypothetical protein
MSQIPLEVMSDNGQADIEDATADEFELGSDLVEDSDEVDKTSDTRPQESSPDSTTEAAVRDEVIDLDTLDLDTIPEHLRQMAKMLKADHTRKTMTTADKIRAVEERERIADAYEQRLRVDRLEEKQVQPAQDPLADLRQRLDQNESGAIDVIDKIDTIRNGEFREQTTQKIDTLTNAVQRLLQYTVNQQGIQAEAKVQTLRQQYPDIDTYKPQTDALANVQNPATGNNYTTEEAYKMVKGISIVESKKINEQDQKARRQPTPSPPANRPAVNGDGAFSDNELTSAMNDLGFTS